MWKNVLSGVFRIRTGMRTGTHNTCNIHGIQGCPELAGGVVRIIRLWTGLISVVARTQLSKATGSFLLACPAEATAKRGDRRSPLRCRKAESGR